MADYLMEMQDYCCLHRVEGELRQQDGERNMYQDSGLKALCAATNSTINAWMADGGLYT